MEKNTRLSVLVILVALCMALCCVNAWAASSYKLMKFSESNSFNACAINDKNQVAGTMVATPGFAHAATWDSTNGYVDLEEGSQSKYCEVTGIGYDGTVIGLSDSSDGTRHAFSWNSSGAHDLGTIGGPDSSLAAINKAGIMVGSSDGAVDHSSRAAYLDENQIWRNIGSLGSESDHNDSHAYGINDENVVVGVSEYEYVYRAFIWDIDNGIRALPFDTTNYSESNAYAINNSGQSVGIVRGHERYDACIWDSASEVTYLNAFTGYESNGAMDINDSGQIVGCTSVDGYDLHACIWEEIDGQYHPAFLPGGNTSAAFAINNNGWIIGWISNDNYYYTPVAWIPVPEPSPFLCVACGGVFLAFRMRRRNT